MLHPRITVPAQKVLLTVLEALFDKHLTDGFKVEPFKYGPLAPLHAHLNYAIRGVAQIGFVFGRCKLKVPDPGWYGVRAESRVLDAPLGRLHLIAGIGTPSIVDWPIFRPLTIGWDGRMGLRADSLSKEVRQFYGRVLRPTWVRSHQLADL